MIINNVMFNATLDEIIDELKSQLQANNIQLLGTIRDTPDNIMVSCPYHKEGQERRPSAGIHKQTGKFHCFACGEVHELHEFIAFCFGDTEVLGKSGWQWLLRNFGTVKVEERKDIDFDFSRKTYIGDTSTVCGSDNFVSDEELEEYRYYHNYMWERGLTKEIVDLFDIGWDWQTDCITFPIRDMDGNCLFVARRSTKTKYFNYPSKAEKPLYGLYEMTQVHIFQAGRRPYRNSEVVVCESMIDALRFWGIHKFAVALNGLGTQLQFKQLRDLPCRKLILATDNDEAGMKARKTIRKNVTNKIITEYIFPKGRKDAGECTDDELLNLEEVF